jgi:hypothetical protein
MSEKLRQRRSLRVEAEDAIINDRVFAVLKGRDYELLIEISRLIQADADPSLAIHDPTRFRLLREGITNCHIRGLGTMNEAGIRSVLRKHGIPEPEYRWTKADLEKAKDTGELAPGHL